MGGPHIWLQTATLTRHWWQRKRNQRKHIHTIIHTYIHTTSILKCFPQACNVFVHLTYKDAVHLERIKQVDQLLYTQTIRQIDNYGQTPLQLFDKPHPERLGLDQV